MVSGKELICSAAHLDDIELSYLGFIFYNFSNYKKIKIVIASTWLKKEPVWEKNLKLLREHIPVEIEYINLGFEQRSLHGNFEKVKDSLYSRIDFNSRFDIVTHDENDCHTDHLALSKIMKGLYKHSSGFLTVHSPSSINFTPNYWIPLGEKIYQIKKEMCDGYSTSKEQSYSKLGYYLQSEDHYNIGRAYQLENFVHTDYSHYECYKALKIIEEIK